MPVFWAALRSRVMRARVNELTQQYAQYWPVFGIGIIWAGPTGTAEPDDGSRASEWPMSHGRGPIALWHTLCGHPPTTVGDRLPATYVQRELFCALATQENMERIVSSTKRTVPRQALEYTMALPWNSTRERLGTS